MTKKLLSSLFIAFLLNLLLLSFPLNKIQAGCYCTNSNDSTSCTIGSACTVCIPAESVCLNDGYSKQCSTGTGADDGSGGCICNTSGSCGESPTLTPTTRPTRTPTPRPTRTPTPTPTITSTPVPTATETPTPTPTLAPDACVCDSFIYNGVFTAGETTDFTAFAKVNSSTYPDAKVNGITYRVERDGTEIANSGEIPADGPVRRLEGTTPFDVYNSIWHYDVPSAGSGEVAYRVWTQISCGSRTAQIIQRLNVAGVSAQRKIKIGFFEHLQNFFSRLLAVLENSQPLAWIKPPKSNVLSAEVQVQNGEVVPTQSMSIKYTNFTPASLIEQTCSGMTFHLIYN